VATIAKFNVLTTFGATRRTTAADGPETFSGAAVDLAPYVNPGGRQLKALLNVGAVTSTGHLNVKMQESSTSAEAGFADIASATFTETGGNASTIGSQEIHFRTNNRYVRALATIQHTGNIDFGVYVVAERKLT
jgi:hypothetical protein